jgi:anti-sigma regulatory factor (Ser/Thr protein kinase)
MQTSAFRASRDPALAIAVRIFVGGVGERWGVSEQVRNDLRLAASELFSGAVEAGGAGPVGFTITSDDGAITLRADGLGPASERSAGPAWDDRFGLVRALFPDADIGDSVAITVRPV